MAYQPLFRFQSRQNQNQSCPRCLLMGYVHALSLFYPLHVFNPKRQYFAKWKSFLQLSSTLPSRRQRNRELGANATVGRHMGFPAVYGNDPPELGIPTVPPLTIMHSAPLSALLSNTNSFSSHSSHIPSAPMAMNVPTNLAPASLFNNNTINSHISSPPINRIVESPQGMHFASDLLVLSSW